MLTKTFVKRQVWPRWEETMSDDLFGESDPGTLVVFAGDAGLHNAAGEPLMSPMFSGKIPNDVLMQVIELLQESEVI